MDAQLQVRREFKKKIEIEKVETDFVYQPQERT